LNAASTYYKTNSGMIRNTFLECCYCSFFAVESRCQVYLLN
jgi:hypothetical protein